MICPAVLDWMETNEPEMDIQGNLPWQTLLMRLGMSETHPSLLERMETNDLNNLLPQTMRTYSGVETEKTMKIAWKKNPSISWTKSSKALGSRKSPSSKPYQILSWSLIATQQGPSVQKTLLLSIICAHSTKLKLLLFQWLNRDGMPNEVYNALVSPTLESPISETSNTMQLSMTSYHTSVINPGRGRDQYPKISLRTITTVPMTQTLEMSNLTRSNESSNHKCLGSLMRKKPDTLETKSARNPVGLLPSLPVTMKLSNSGFKPPGLHPLVSQALNGTISSEDKLLTLTSCSPRCTMYLLLKRTLDMWEQLKSPLVNLSLLRKSKWVASGPAPGTLPSKWLNLLSPIRRMSSESMESISKDTFQPRSHLYTAKSSCMTLQSGTKLVGDRMPYLQTHITSPNFIQQLSCQMGLS